MDLVGISASNPDQCGAQIPFITPNESPTGGINPRAIVLVSLILAAIMTIFLGIHTANPSMTIDSTSLGLLGLIFVALLVPFAKSITFPGGTKIDLGDVASAREAVSELEAKEPRLAPEAPTAQPEMSWRSLLYSDTNVALAGLRVEIERKVREIAQKTDLQSRARFEGLVQLVRRMQRAEILSQEEANAIVSVVEVCNKAVHAQKISPEAAQLTADLGARVLFELDGKLRELEKRGPGRRS